MRVIALSRLRAFWELGYADAEQPLRAWYREVAAADWSDPHDLKARFPRASILGNNRVVFDICGHRYRLIAVVDFVRKGVLVRWIGTHAEYDCIDAREV